jgi:hypothetical protein
MRIATVCVALLSLGGLATSAWADDYNDPSQYSRSRSQDQSSSLRMEPRGHIVVAYDYDGDGTFDAFETITPYELEQQRSARRMSSSGQSFGMSQGSPAFSRSSGGSQQFQPAFWEENQSGGQSQGQWSQQSQNRRISGTIKDIATHTKQGKTCVVATIQTQAGRNVCVALGSPDEVAELDLQRGDHINATGITTTVDEHPVLIATKINYEGQTLSVNPDARQWVSRLQKSSGQQQYNGQVLSLRTASFQGVDSQCVLAKVRLSDGDTKTVNLGPKDDIQQLQLQPGDELQFTAKHCSVNGRPCLAAQRVEANNKFASINWSQAMSGQGGMSDQMQTAGYGSQD